MKSIIIYYSRTGRTKLIAQTLAKEKNMKIVEIKDKTNRSGAIGFIKGTLDSMINNSTTIEPVTIDLDKYDTVYIGTPVWASKITPAIKQILDNINLENKNVITFVTLNKNGAKEALNSLNSTIKDKGGKIINSFSIITKGRDIESLTKDIVKNLGK